MSNKVIRSMSKSEQLWTTSSSFETLWLYSQLGKEPDKATLQLNLITRGGHDLRVAQSIGLLSVYGSLSGQIFFP